MYQLLAVQRVLASLIAVAHLIIVINLGCQVKAARKHGTVRGIQYFFCGMQDL